MQNQHKLVKLKEKLVVYEGKLAKEMIGYGGVKHESAASEIKHDKVMVLRAMVDGLKEEMLEVFKEFKSRKEIIEIKEKKDLEFKLTKKGTEILSDLSKIKKMSFVEDLTPEMIKAKEWKNRKFRHYELNSKAPVIYGGKKQPYREFLDKVRQKFLSMGFAEMTGPLVETEFWDMDALFMPQFHSARDIHEAYHVKNPRYGDLDEEIVKKVIEAHENGVDGSKGWNYEFNEEKTKRLILRTQTTALSARQLSSKDLKIPGKYFGIARCFRYDVIDYKHLPDFNQVEGIVIGENLNFQHLKGLLRMFAKEFAGIEEIKITPAYFPFTEPSCELHAKHPKLGWIELGGAGILRPEVCKPLGVNVPVLAWGLGIDRLAMFNLEIADIRQLYSHDLRFLRGGK